MAWLVDLFNSVSRFFGSIVNNPMITIGLITLIIAVVIGFVFYNAIKPERQVLYLSEEERTGEFLTIEDMTPNILHAEGNKKFIRNTLAYTIKEGMKTITLSLGKRGTAYTFKPASTPKGKAQKIGTLWDGLKSVWNETEWDAINPELKQKLMNSEIFVTIELESGQTPKDAPRLSEDDLFTEANKRMAQLIGEGIKESFSTEDWIRNAALIGSGVALLAVSQMMGIV